MEKRSALNRFWQLINTDKSDLIAIYFYAILSGLVQLSVPVGVQSIIGFVLGASMVTSIYVLLILVVLGVFIVGVLQINQMRIIEKIQQKIFTRYAFNFTDKIPKFDLYKTDNYYLPEKVNRFFDTLSLQKGISKLLLEIPTAIIQILFGLILLALYHPLFIAFGFILLLTLWMILKLTSNNGLKTSLQESTYKYELVSWLQEMARTVRSFKFSQDAHLDVSKTDKLVVGYLSSRTDHFKVLLFQYKTLVGFKVLITAILLSAGVYLLVNQKLNIGEFIAAEIVILTIISATEKIIKSLDSVYDVMTGMEKLDSVTENYSEQDGSMELTAENIGLELIDFNLKYPDGNTVLKNINLKIKPNSSIAIMGDEGSGKTTLLKVLSGSYKEYDGIFLINNISINNYQLASLRKKIGFYFNHQEIFTGTVLENISMGRADITPEKIIMVAKKVGFEQFLQNLPLGFETVIDINGKRLPNSITKKILLLRALCHHPYLIIVDDPCQGLENHNKDVLNDYLLSKPNNATIIVTTSDMSFAKKCDQIIVLNNGEIKILNNN
ncbi:ATP-binding cassette domain-containing protein [Ferruginibacter lapsinanis]|uniref:peptidase domain-containing ABC transporter n=1 Tax=Ferruginibacter lapsinanis TaxID=563172 RepID=UPI001E3751DF|nr:ATP-binding cassette domain-containing protein [Ferruginibacter lapsinanis]UEG49025.1 ATP-binding cassette domain-containing protein [Ferruginibacter lapsinanis]